MLVLAQKLYYKSFTQMDCYNVTALVSSGLKNLIMTFSNNIMDV